MAYDCPTSHDQCPAGYDPVSCSFMNCASNCYCDACGGDSFAGQTQTYIHCSGACYNNATQQFVNTDCSYQYYQSPNYDCSSGECNGNYGGYAYLGSC